MDASRIALEVLTIAEPCHENWDAMNGDAQRRFCAACNKHVHDLTRMTRSAAEELVCRDAGNLCVRMGYDASGAVVTLDYAKPATRRRWPFRIAMTGLIACIAATSSFVRRPAPPLRMVAGKITVPRVVSPPANTAVR